jgi:pimeloyl-ACP methyl ester carboxylesterase
MTDTAMTTHEIAVNGITLHYVTWGQFTRPERAVLLIHGLTASSRSWVNLGPVLAARGWYAIAPDLRGRGLSEKPPHGYGIPYHVNDLLAMGDLLGLPVLNLVGHSLGALISLFLAAIHPQRAGKIVLVDAGGKLPDDVLQAIAVSLARLDTVYPSLAAYLEAMRQAPMYQWSPFWEQYFRYDAEVRADGTVTSRVRKAAIDEENAVNFATRTEALPNAVRAPALILRAPLGTLAPDRGFVLPAEEAERLRAVIPGSRLVEIPDTNHYTIILSDVFTHEVIAFLEETP